MDLYLSILADELQDYKQEIAFEMSNETPLRNVRILSRESHPGYYDNRDVFLIDSSYLKSIGNKELLPQNMIVIGKTKERDLELSKKSILYLENVNPEKNIFYHLQDIFKEYNDWEKHIQNVIIHNKDISAVLETVVKKLHNPIAIFDAGSSLIHWAGDISGNTRDTIWEDVLEKGYSMDFYSLSEWKDLATRMDTSNYPFCYKSKQDQVHLACPIKVNGKLVASLGMTELNRSITDGQMRIVTFIRKMFEMAFINSNINRITNESSSYYIECLLNNIFVEEKIIQHYLSRRSWKIRDTYRILLLSYPITAHMDTITEPYIDRIKSKFPHGLHCIHENSAIVILNITREEYTRNEIEEKLAELFSKYQIQTGISVDFFTFTDLRYYYIQCKSVLQFGRKEAPNKALFYVLDYYDDIVVRSLDSATSLKSLCHPRLLELWRTKGAGRDSLVETLYSYLNNGRNNSKTAAVLHIHRNSLSYRLEKISDLLGVSLDEIDPEESFYLLMSCKILQKMK